MNASSATTSHQNGPLRPMRRAAGIRPMRNRRCTTPKQPERDQRGDLHEHEDAVRRERVRRRLPMRSAALA